MVSHTKHLLVALSALTAFACSSNDPSVDGTSSGGSSAAGTNATGGTSISAGTNATGGTSISAGTNATGGRTVGGAANGGSGVGTGGFECGRRRYCERNGRSDWEWWEHSEHVEGLQLGEQDLALWYAGHHLQHERGWFGADVLRTAAFTVRSGESVPGDLPVSPMGWLGGYGPYDVSVKFEVPGRDLRDAPGIGFKR